MDEEFDFLETEEDFFEDLLEDDEDEVGELLLFDCCCFLLDFDLVVGLMADDGLRLVLVVLTCPKRRNKRLTLITC